MKGVLKFKGNAGGILIFLTLVFSCQQKDQKPAELLSRDDMVKTLAEIYISEEKISRLGLNTDSATQVFSLLEGRMFKKLGLSDSVFRQSIDYYTDHPAEMELIYSALVDSLQLREQRAPHQSTLTQ